MEVFVCSTGIRGTMICSRDIMTCSLSGQTQIVERDLVSHGEKVAFVPGQLMTGCDEVSWVFCFYQHLTQSWADL